ncbi:MAG: hypothetical protein RBR02_06085 [Desulfuromonadaceae bacterium]|nr:hypothetical protein [Desulfuromonadaceae bacterium]
MSVGWENVVAGNGVGLAISGTIIIFLSLLSISLFIHLLPRVLALVDGSAKDLPVSEAAMPSTPEPLTEAEKEVVIALVLHMELEYLSGESGRVTLRPHASRSMWSSSARMRSLSSWSHHA